MKVIILDCERFTSKSSAHEYIKQNLGFPEYYGANLDALDDCLSELAHDISVVLINSDAAKMYLDDYADGIFDDFLDVLGTRGRAVIL